MEELAVVRQVLDQQVIVESKVKSTCSQCQQVDNCGSGIVAKAIPHKSLSVAIDTNDTFKVGDEVVISIPENVLLDVAWQVYLIPLMGLILLGGLAQYLLVQTQFLSAEWQAIVLSLIGGYCGHRIAKWLQSRNNNDKILAPKIKHRVIASQVL